MNIKLQLFKKNLCIDNLLNRKDWVEDQIIDLEHVLMQKKSDIILADKINHLKNIFYILNSEQNIANIIIQYNGRPIIPIYSTILLEEKIMKNYQKIVKFSKIVNKIRNHNKFDDLFDD